MTQGQIIVLSGPSGVGKGTIRDRLDLDRLNVENSISMTTRKPRATDAEGVTYYFTDMDDFEKRIDNGEFLESCMYQGNRYGTLKREVDRILSKGKNVLLEIETEGASRVLSLYPDCISVFILPPTFETLEERIRRRGDTNEANIAGRLQRAKEEMAMKDMYSRTVVNDDLDIAVNTVQSYFEEQLKERNAL